MLPAMHDPTPGGKNDGGVEFIIDAVGCFNVCIWFTQNSGYFNSGAIILAIAQQYLAERYHQARIHVNSCILGGYGCSLTNSWENQPAP